jgi:TM2 domain-containing membrane protein YozV
MLRVACSSAFSFSGGGQLHGAPAVTAVLGLLIYTGSFAIGAMGIFLLFGSLTLVALRYFWREVPETKGRSLPELEQDLAGRAVG